MTSDSLTDAEVREIAILHRDNDVLAKEVSKLTARLTEEKEKRREYFVENDVETEPSKAYLRDIRLLRKDSRMLELVQQWRAARLQCASYSETIEEVHSNFLEMKNLYGQLQERKTKS